MVVNKRKKVTKYRAHTTHGGGHRKKRRGAGSRGGRGNAGTGKRAGHKKAGMSRKLGKKGFTSHVSKSKSSDNTLNLSYFSLDNINKLVDSGKATKQGEFYTIDLAKLGYGKLLGTGNVVLKLKITVPSCSSRAAEKIKDAGGEVISSKESSKNKTEDKNEDKIKVEG
ncbi:MAG: uL15m family ribosomal protein [Nanoarchaeota archaeon]|nr:uL15 family ribosomal protein [Nanoarchaeota archaeon]MBU1632754.1 uL15 family ribosomal protein [Nanoarchaeota archaeon]MBU1876505.1 uL15 family ribosomal protein [Nanoarchaeota archaeon]